MSLPAEALAAALLAAEIQARLLARRIPADRRPDTDDLLQEARLAVLLRLPRWSGDGSAERFAAVVARNAALDAVRAWNHRKQAYRSHPATDEPGPADLPPLPWEEVWAEGAPDETEDVLLREAVRRAVWDLPPRERALIVLRYWDELLQREVGERLGLPPTTVGFIERRTLLVLRGVLGGEQ